MVARQPSVIDRSASLIISRAERLAAVSGLPVEHALKLTARQPLLLELSPEQLMGQVNRLGEVLGADPKGVLQLLARLDNAGLRTAVSFAPYGVPDRLQDLVESLGLPGSSTDQLDLMTLMVREIGVVVWDDHSNGVVFGTIVEHQCCLGNNVSCREHVITQATCLYVYSSSISLLVPISR